MAAEQKPSPPPSQLLLQHFARIGHAASSPHRLKILNLLCQGSKPVEWLAEQTGQSIASTSAHLQVLRGACLVEAEKRGRYVYYAVAGDTVARFWQALKQVGEERLPEVREVVREYFEDPETLLKLSPRELLAGVKQGQFTLLDVRPDDEYRHGHLPGAVSVPFDQLARGIKDLPKRRKVVAYCRGPYCVTAVEAVARLRAKGVDAYRLPLGVAEWRAAGLALETVSGAARA